MTVLGALAQNVAASLIRGDSVIVVGRLQLAAHCDPEGRQHVVRQIFADHVGPTLRSGAWVTQLDAEVSRG